MIVVLIGVLLIALVSAGDWGADDDPEPVFGGPDSDSIEGGAGRDILHGEAGNDTLLGLAGSDSLYGGSGQDSVSGGDGDDFLNGGQSIDVLDGGAGNDILDSRTGDDTNTSFATFDGLNGGAGDDWLIAGGGEGMNGGEGHDIFDLTPDIIQAIPRLVDYNPGEDRIVIRYDPARTANPGFDIEPDAAGQNFFITMNGDYVGIILGEFGIDFDDFILLPHGAPIPPRA